MSNHTVGPWIAAQKLPKAVEAGVEGTGRRVEVWCMDEHRIGLKPIIGRVWAERGKAPTVPVQHRFQWLYLYAFACPQTGEGQYWLMPAVNTEAFQKVLERLRAVQAQVMSARSSWSWTGRGGTPPRSSAARMV